MAKSLKAPFPYFGGKSRIASIVWELLGDVRKYIEPFCGSAAVLLARPSGGVRPKEVVNDSNCFICNFWRAVKAAPEEVAKHCDYPVVHLDLTARHRWLLSRAPSLKEMLLADPDAFDAKAAGWWAWGASAWIGSQWCFERHARPGRDDRNFPSPIPRIGRDGRDVQGLPARIRHDEFAGRLSSTSESAAAVCSWMIALSQRLRRVHVVNGDWRRVLGPGSLEKDCLCGVFLDPPYQRVGRSGVYNDESTVFEDVWRWAMDRGNDPDLRIVLCGYDDGRVPKAGWQTIPWRANGGYGNMGQSNGRANKHRERIWASPGCLIGEGRLL